MIQQQQSGLEKAGKIQRDIEIARSDYNKHNEYSENHPDALSDLGKEHPERGKGTNSSYTHTMPQEYNDATKNRIKAQLNTSAGGGSFDIYGRNDVSGRERVMSYNKYSAVHPYYADGKVSIDTSGNIEDGQYVVK